MMLTDENYYSRESNIEYFSASQVKSFKRCEACGLAELNGTYQREETSSLLVGGYVDAHFDRSLDLFKAQHPSIFTKQGDLKAEYKRANGIIERLERDPLAMRMMDGDRQKIVTGTIGGAPFKAKLDFLLGRDTVRKIADDFPGMADLALEDGAIVDLKTTKDFQPMYKEGEGRISFIEYWGYTLQLAIYRELVRQQTGLILPCYILAATKEEVPDIRLFRIPEHAMDTELELLEGDMEHLMAVKSGDVEPERCEECNYCKETRVLGVAEYAEEWGYFPLCNS